jgi:hypothetical protein
VAPLPGGDSWPHVEIVLADPCSLSGRVLDPAGRPVSHASLRVARWPSADVHTVCADARGEYGVDALDPGEYLVVARAVGYVPTVLESVLVDAAGTEVDIPLDRGTSVHGRVVDEQGAAVSEASVHARRPVDDARAYADRWWVRRYLASAIARTRSDGRGDYTLENVPPGHLVLLATAPGYEPSDAVPAEGGGGASEIVLERYCRLQGHVLDAETGGPIPEFRISVVPAAFQPQQLSFDLAPRRYLRPSGGFVVKERPAGEYRVIVQAEGYADWRSAVTLRPDEERVLEPRLLRGFSISGRAFDTVTGAGVPQAIVVGQSRDPDPWSELSYFVGYKETRTRADGSFSIDGLAAGNYWVGVSHPEFERASVESRLSITVPDEAERVLEFPMTPSGVVRGTIRFASGRRWSFDRRVVLIRADGDVGAHAATRKAWLHGGARWANEPSTPYLLRLKPGAYEVYFEEQFLPAIVGADSPPLGTDLAGGVVERRRLGAVEVRAGETTTFDSVVE